MKTFRTQEKRWNLPEVVRFEGKGLCFYEVTGYRQPEKGEFFLSGAIVEGYKAPNRLSEKYLIAQPTKKAHRKTTYVPSKA